MPPDRVPERTEDGHHVVIDGRRWRATDPALPEDVRTELVAELMAARRAVRTDPATARPRVQDAKVALGERGTPWWETADDAALAARRDATARALARHRGTAPEACAADAARATAHLQTADPRPST